MHGRRESPSRNAESQPCGAAGRTAGDVDAIRLPDVTGGDPPLTTAMAGEEIDPAFITQLRQQLSSLLEDEKLLADWFARYMTQPKLPGHRQDRCR